MYFLLGFVVVTLSKCPFFLACSPNLTLDVVTEVYYLNVALALFNTGTSVVQMPLLTAV